MIIIVGSSLRSLLLLLVASLLVGQLSLLLSFVWLTLSVNNNRNQDDVPQSPPPATATQAAPTTPQPEESTSESTSAIASTILQLRASLEKQQLVMSSLQQQVSTLTTEKTIAIEQAGIAKLEAMEST